jgi:putative acetyltransferase
MPDGFHVHLHRKHHPCRILVVSRPKIFSYFPLRSLITENKSSGHYAPAHESIIVKHRERGTDQENMRTVRNVTESGIVVVSYDEDYRPEFEELNRQWIETYFTLEPADREILSDPRGKILEKGGQVFFVLEHGHVKGTCAVLRETPEECEIAKMAVAPSARGRGFGDLLMEACIAFAKASGARRAVIVSNTALQPAIRLYRKHGFVQVPLAADPRYERGNIRLELELDATEPA